MCPICQSHTDAQGRCWDKECANARPPEERKPGARRARTPLKKQSAKKRKEVRETNAIRKIEPGEQCELCQDNASETHEICGGAHRQRAVRDRRAQIRVCRSCHDHIQGLPYELQLVLLLESKIAGINECVGRVAVDLESVKECL